MANKNLRQHAILTQMLERAKPMPVDKLRRAPEHQLLYAKLGDKTKQRDLSDLSEQGLLVVDEKALSGRDIRNKLIIPIQHKIKCRERQGTYDPQG